MERRVAEFALVTVTHSRARGRWLENVAVDCLKKVADASELADHGVGRGNGAERAIAVDSSIINETRTTSELDGAQVVFNYALRLPANGVITIVNGNVQSVSVQTSGAVGATISILQTSDINPG